MFHFKYDKKMFQEGTHVDFNSLRDIVKWDKENFFVGLFIGTIPGKFMKNWQFN
jgi:hypothetical protein